VRDGSADWRGDVFTSSGKINVGDGVFGGPYSFASRFEDGDGTKPEQLVAAALAGCFTMALSNLLTEAGHPKAVAMHARRCPPPKQGRRDLSLSRIDLDTIAHMPGLAEA
jgi:lipoyl-dependent peroxiredoxin